MVSIITYALSYRSVGMCLSRHLKAAKKEPGAGHARIKILVTVKVINESTSRESWVINAGGASKG